jgi:hypothetical protein
MSHCLPFGYGVKSPYPADTPAGRPGTVGTARCAVRTPQRGVPASRDDRRLKKAKKTLAIAPPNKIIFDQLKGILLRGIFLKGTLI